MGSVEVPVFLFDNNTVCTGLSSQIEDNSGQCCENEQSIGSYLLVSVLVSLNWGAFSHTELSLVDSKEPLLSPYLFGTE